MPRNFVNEDIRLLENILAEYREVRQENDIVLADLIKGNRALTTNQALLREATLDTKTLDDKAAARSHQLAKEAFMLWCLIYCEKVLMSKYSKRDSSRETIAYGAKMGMMQCFEKIKEGLTAHFDLPEEERAARLEGLSVRAYMLGFARNQTLREFQKDLKNLIRVSPEQAEEYRAKGIPVIEGKNGQYYIHRFTPVAPVNRETGETFDLSDVTERAVDDTETNAHTLMDRRGRVGAVENLLARIVQSGACTELEEEFIRDVMCGKMKPQEKLRDWQARGIEIPNHNIYRFRDAVRKKFLEAMDSDMESWRELAGR